MSPCIVADDEFFRVPLSDSFSTVTKQNCSARFIQTITLEYYIGSGNFSLLGYWSYLSYLMMEKDIGLHASFQLNGLSLVTGR